MEDLKKCMLVRKITVGKDLVETPQRGEQAKAARDSLSSLERQPDPVGPCKNYKCWEKMSEKHGETASNSVSTPVVPKNLDRLTRMHMPVATGKVFGLESGSMSQLPRQVHLYAALCLGGRIVKSDPQGCLKGIWDVNLC